jgi:hypothetical protein
MANQTPSSGAGNQIITTLPVDYQPLHPAMWRLAQQGVADVGRGAVLINLQEARGAALPMRYAPLGAIRSIGGAGLLPAGLWEAMDTYDVTSEYFVFIINVRGGQPPVAIYRIDAGPPPPDPAKQAKPVRK